VSVQSSSILVVAADGPSRDAMVRRLSDQGCHVAVVGGGAEAECRGRESRFELATLASKMGVWDWDLVTGEVYYSAWWKAMLGYGDEEVDGTPEAWLSRLHPTERPKIQSVLDGLLDGRTEVSDTEHRVLHKDGHYRWVQTRALLVRDEEGKPRRMVGAVSDITSVKVADLLTGLPNRLLFADRLGHCLARMRRRSGYLFAVLFLDLDHFKDVNDSLGHLVGDQLLIQVGQRIERCVRATDTVGRLPESHTVARLGGDEFTILLEDLSTSLGAALVAERIQRAIGQPFFIGGHEIFTSVSIGIVTGTAAYEHPDDILRDADTAMYRAKAEGRARFAVFDPAQRTAVVERLQLAHDLKRALERREFRVVYQPVVDLQTGRLAGFESLVRWLHPTRGAVPPSAFIQLAEETGLIVPLGQWVFRESCETMARWCRNRVIPDSFKLSVNMSGREFTQPNVVEFLQSVLDDTGAPANRLTIEITESVLMQHAQVMARRIAQFRALGLQIAIDDFGTGYSSLSYLHEFAVDTLKIDRSFVSRISATGEHIEIARAVIALAHNLGLSVVAEGVETPEQFAWLARLGCEFGQGFCFARPGSLEDVEALLDAGTIWTPSGREAGQRTLFPTPAE